MLLRCFYHGFRRHVAPQVQHVIAVIFQKRFNDILSNIMNVAFYGRHNNFPFAAALFSRRRDRILYDFKRRLRRACGLQKLRQEQYALFKTGAHRVQRRNEHLIDKLLRAFRL